jgi:HAD superfamily hydrolase (TIGR01509 family)
MSPVLHGIDAVLWDMDGLLVDSEPLWTVAETELAEHHGAVWTDEIKAACMGHRLDSAVPIMLRELGLDPALQESSSRFLLQRMVQLYAGGAPVLPGACDLLALPLPHALVSSSYRVLVDAVTRWFPAGTFQVTLAGDEVTYAKPDPEPYRSAAELLGLDPRRCLVLEDSTAGARAGLAAGCRVVLVAGHPATVVPDGVVLLESLTQLGEQPREPVVGAAQSSRSGCSATIRS